MQCASWSLLLRTLCLVSSAVLASCQSKRVEPALVIVRSQAEATALAEAPGSTIVSGLLEKRDERWVWAFQAVSPGLASPRELLVNARTGDAIPPKSVAQSNWKSEPAPMTTTTQPQAQLLPPQEQVQ